MRTVKTAEGQLIPLANIYCIGRNYAKHAAELGNKISEKPLVFLKSTSALRALDNGRVAFGSESFHHEAELVFLVSQDYEPDQIPGPESLQMVALGLDLTRRTEQDRIKREGHPWTLAKSFLGSALVGPFVPISGSILSFQAEFTLAVQGETRQRGQTHDMLHKPLDLARYIHSFSPLQRGDLIFSGTPEGVGPLLVGNEFELWLSVAGDREHRWAGRL